MIEIGKKHLNFFKGQKGQGCVKFEPEMSNTRTKDTQ